MPENLPCPICKNPIGVADADARGKVCCALCLHEFQLRGQRLTPWVDLEGINVSFPTAAEPTGQNITVLDPLPPAAVEPEYRPRSRRRENTRRVPARTGPSKLLIIGLIIIGAIVTGLAAVPGIIRHQHHRDAFFPNRRPAFRVVEAIPQQEPLPPPDLVVPEALRREVRAHFDELAKVFHARDVNALTAQFDIERMIDEVAAQDDAPGALLADRQGFERGFRQGFRNTLDQQVPFLDFDRFEIMAIRDLGGDDAEVVVRGSKEGNGFVARHRFWISKRTGVWLIYDFEDLDMNLRTTYLVGSIARIFDPREAREFAQRFNALKEAIIAAAAQNIDLAERKLGEAGPQAFPAPVEALRHTILAGIHLHRNKPREALAEFASARRLNPHMAKLDFGEAVAHNQLGESAKALELLERYRKFLGDDADVCRELAYSLRGLNRFPEALVQLKKALDYFPKDHDTFLMYLQTLGPGDKRDDVGDRFAKIDNPGQHFEMLAQNCLNAHDWTSLELLAKSMANIDPPSTGPDYYLALARVHENKTDEALRLIKQAVARENDEQLKANYWERFEQSLVNTGKAQVAYSLAPDPQHAFRHIGGALQKSFRVLDLRRLVAVHKKAFPDDALIPLFQALVCVQDGDHEKAEILFAEAVDKQADAALVNQAQSQRIYNRYRLGKAMSAFEELGPKDQAFTQLAQLAWGDRDKALLEKLVDAQEAFNDKHDTLGSSRYRLKLLGRQGGEAVALFKQALAAIRDEQARKNFIDNFVFDCLDTDLGMVAYQNVPDPRLSFQRLAGDYLDQGKRDELTSLIAFHRKRFSSDPWIDFYQGQLHLNDRAWGPAAKSLESAWGNASVEEKNRIQYSYFHAMVKGSQGLKAYQAAADKSKAFIDISREMIASKQWANLNKLIAEHRAPNSNDPTLLMISVRAQIAAKRIDAAAPLLEAALAMQPADYLRANYIREFIGDLDDQGLGIDGYRRVADRAAAFDALASRYQSNKKLDLLEALIREHSQASPGDPRLPRYRGHVALERGDFANAEKEFRAGVAAAKTEWWPCKMGLERVSVKSGKAAQFYAESGDDAAAFGNIANTCVQEKDAAQLKALIEAHRAKEPDDPALPRWDLECLFLAKDYAGVVAMHAALVKGPRRVQDEHFLNDRLVRALIHLKQFDEAERVAEEASKKRYADRLLSLLAAAASGDVEKTLAVGAKARPMPYNLIRFYQDADLGPLLRQDAFRRFRDRYPEPPPDQAFPLGRFGDDFD